MDQYLERSPSFYLKRAQKTFKNIIENNRLRYHLDFLNYIKIENGFEYEFLFQDMTYRCSYFIRTIDDLKQDIARDIEATWHKYSRKGAYLPVKLEVYAYEGPQSNIIGVRLLYDPKTYYYMLAERDVNKILEDYK
jgi:hypothetical protein